MKSFTNIINKLKIKTIFFHLYFFSILTLITSNTISKSKTEICTNSEEYINSFFSGKEQDLSEEYQSFTPTKLYQVKNDFILNSFFLNEDDIKTYQNQRFSKINLYKIILIAGLLLSIVIAFNFDFHFMCRLHENEESDDNYIGNFMNICKISSFTWVKYLMYNKEKMNEFYIHYKKNELPKTNITLKIFLLFISFILLICSIIITLYNNFKSESPTKATFNISCALNKFLYEIKNGKNNYTGLDIINEFFSEFEYINEKNEQTIQKFNDNFITIENLISEWDNYINNLINSLSDSKSGKFYITSYSSGEICNNENIETCESIKYQLEIIYYYYQSNDGKINLYQIKEFMHKNIEKIYTIVKQYNDINKNILNLISKNNENIYYNILSKSSQLLDIYIDKFNEIYLPDIHNYFIYNILPFLFNIDFAFAVLLGFCCLLFIPVISYSFNKKCMKNKLSIVILFYNGLFVLLILSILNCIKIITVKTRSIYVEDISSVIYFLFDADNLDYLNEIDDYTINNDDFNIKDENQDSKNIFYYLNYIVNNKKNITELFEIDLTKINRKKINTLYNQLENVFRDNTQNIIKKKITNTDLENITNELLKILNNGLAIDTEFTTLTGQEKITPNNYFENINKRTQANKRAKNSIIDFDCDESWSISTTQQDGYTYINKKEIIDCEGCTNRYFNKNNSKKYLLNYPEYKLDEIIERYSDLKNKNFSEIYYQIINQFKSLEKFRDDNFQTQINNLCGYNKELIDLQNSIFENLNKSVYLSNEIITSYENLFIKYSIDDNYSFLNWNFIKNDINFILYVAENSFLKAVNKFYFIHLLGNISHILLSIILSIFYSIVSYDIPLPKKRPKQKVDHTSIIQEIKELKKQKYEDPDRSGDILRGAAFMNSNIGGNVSIVKGGTTINNNNINPHYNTLFCGNNGGNDLNADNLLNLNKKIEKELNGLNVIFNQNTLKSPTQPIKESQNENDFNENNGAINGQAITNEIKNICDNLNLNK